MLYYWVFLSVEQVHIVPRASDLQRSDSTLRDVTIQYNRGKWYPMDDRNFDRDKRESSIITKVLNEGPMMLKLYCICYYSSSNVFEGDERYYSQLHGSGH